MKLPALRAVLIFTGWTGTSFFSYLFAMMFLQLTRKAELSYQSLNLICLTGLQTLLFLLLIKPIVQEIVILRRYSFISVVVCHVTASFTMNLCLSELNHPYTFVLRMMEPLPGKETQMALLGFGLTSVQFTGLPFTAIATLLLSFEAGSGLMIPLRTVLLFVSNILIAVRNSVIKQAYRTDAEIQTCSKYKCNVILISVAFFLLWFILGLLITMKDNSAKDSFIAGMYLVTSAALHVVFSYVSTAIVLKHMTVVTHAMTNLCRRLFVFGLLYLIQLRTVSWFNGTILILCFLGLFLGCYAFRNENAHKPVVINVVDI